MRFRVLEISIYAYVGGEIATHGVKRKAITQAVVTAACCITVGCGCTWFSAMFKVSPLAKQQIWLLALILLDGEHRRDIHSDCRN